MLFFSVVETHKQSVRVVELPEDASGRFVQANIACGIRVICHEPHGLLANVDSPLGRSFQQNSFRLFGVEFER